MNRPEIERLIKKYKRMRHAGHFQMPFAVTKTTCGTACCIAGQELIDNGYKPIWDKDVSNIAWYFKSPKGRRVFGLDAARQLLQITKPQSDDLFLKMCWPSDLAIKPDTPALAAERLQRFLDTNGSE